MKKKDHFLDQLFNPKFLAIVGATNGPFKMGAGGVSFAYHRGQRKRDP